MGGGKRMRLPGIEPGPSRWQRDIITTRLKALFAAVGGFQLPQSINHAALAPGSKKLLVGESNPGRLRDRQKCYQLHQRGLLAWAGQAGYHPSGYDSQVKTGPTGI